MSAPANCSNGRCGPLCQHPGCWQSTNTPQKRSSSYYEQYLTRLTSRKSKNRHSLPNESTLTTDGLPTLKMHTLDQEQVRGASVRRPTLPMPPVTNRDKEDKRGVYNDKVGLMVQSRAVNFVQMHLQEKPIDYDEMDDLLFSPILIWKSGKHPHARHITHPPHAITVTEAQLSPSHTPSHPLKTKRPLSGGCPTPRDTHRVKTPLHLNRTDLTDLLPLEETHSSPSKKKDAVHQQRVTTAEAENFSYLDDLPRHVMAEIIHQLRSESSIDVHRSPQQIASVISQKPNHTHVPSSLTYDLSTKRLTRTQKLSRPKTMTSFSRELSKRPLEVLRKKLPDIGLGNLQTISENKTVRPSLIDPVAVEIPKHSARTSKSLEILLQKQANTGENTTLQEPNSDEKQISPRRVNLQLSDAFLKSIEPSLKRPNSRIRVPSFSSQQPISDNTAQPRPPLTTEERRIDSLHALLPSTSPDFMLLGAQLSGNELVLTDRAGKIVHQLTEGDDSQPDIVTTSTEELGVCGQDEELLPSGVQPPPSTAVDLTSGTHSVLGQPAQALSVVADISSLTEENSQVTTQTNIDCDVG